MLSGCSDNAMVTTYDKQIINEKIPCMRLVVFPPDNEIQKTLEVMYSFKKECNFTLNVSNKGGITCNSTQNATNRALSNFPSSYLKIELKKESSLLYSYYIDLKSDVKESDIKNAFNRIKNDLLK